MFDTSWLAAIVLFGLLMVIAAVLGSCWDLIKGLWGGRGGGDKPWEYPDDHPPRK